MRYSKIAAAATLAACSGWANANVIINSIDLRMVKTDFAVQSDTTRTEALAVFDAEGFCSKSLDAFTGINSQATCDGGRGSDQNGYGAIYTIKGRTSAPVEFQFGLDWGRGGFVVFNDQERARFDDTQADDLWWATNWSNSDVLKGPDFNLNTAGSFTLTLLGFEGCCDGINSAQYRSSGSTPSANGGQWQDLQVNAVPLPGSLPLMGLGALMLLRRRIASRASNR